MATRGSFQRNTWPQIPSSRQWAFVDRFISDHWSQMHLEVLWSQAAPLSWLSKIDLWRKKFWHLQCRSQAHTQRFTDKIVDLCKNVHTDLQFWENSHILNFIHLSSISVFTQKRTDRRTDRLPVDGFGYSKKKTSYRKKKNRQTSGRRIKKWYRSTILV